ncbi:diaminopimelate epimerase [Rhizobium laguerreae]|uniref:hypothetical protein n=1 Tax=Rhizobium laguerreae TaxID=1076926 RepID=UPI001C910757|nr:hypothetical protein [Rhizobium laguerreae]MBY3307621.1 diaminopimelate epimerase [Rhizobium laguerreae]
MINAEAIYSARGNVYAIVEPDVAQQIAGLPTDHHGAADFLTQHGKTFCQRAIASLEVGSSPSDRHGSPIDGFVIGPFSVESGFGAVIINTDGSLAERSGNGLTNFARYLDDRGQLDRRRRHSFIVDAGRGRRTITKISVGEIDGRSGYWLEMGCIRFGVDAVDANLQKVIYHGDGSFTVPPLCALSSSWTRSVFTNVGNPHCVTFLDREETLWTNRQLRAPLMFEALKAIAFKPDTAEHRQRAPFKEGVNLQWAHVDISGEVIHARIFERGEGPTASSGTSATAIAAAARYLGLTTANLVRVATPGGTAHVDLVGGGDDMAASFFGLSESARLTL